MINYEFLKNSFINIFFRKDFFLFPLILIAGLGLTGWLIEKQILSSVSDKFIPIAPDSSMLFLIISFLLFFNVNSNNLKLRKIGTVFITSLIILYCSILLCSFLFHFNLEIDSFFIKNPEKFGNVLKGKMSPITSSLFILTCINIIFLTLKSINKVIKNLINLIIFIASFIFLTGYLFKAPLLYGSSIIPVALPTAFCFLLLSLTFIRLNDLPFGFSDKNTIHNKLIRTFLPIVISVIVLQGFLYTNIFSNLENPTLISAIVLFVAIILSVLLINKFAVDFGSTITLTENLLKEKNNELQKSISKIEESETTYRELFNNMMNGFAYCKMEYKLNEPFDFTFISVNNAFEKQTGLKDVIGKKVSQVIPGFTETDKPLLDIFSEVALTEIPKQFEIYVHSLKMWLEISAYSPETNYFATIFNVINTRKQTEESLQKNEELLRTLLNNAPITIFATDNKGVFTFSDGKQLELVNLKPGENVGLSAIDLYESFPFEEESGVITKGKDIVYRVLNGETIYSFSELNNIWFKNHMVPLKSADGDITGLLGVSIDITRQKQFEKELVVAKMKAEESERLKSAFLANISHEIRTPMNGIIGYSEFLLEQNISKKEQNEYASIVNKSAKRLLTLLNNVMDISKIESGQMQVRLGNFNINTLIEEVYLSKKILAEEKHLEFSFKKGMSNENAFINSYESAYYQILSNLISNAFKFTEKGKIEFGCTKVGNSVELYVKDTGIGISQDYIPKLFNRFSQEMDAMNRKHEGAGLGLSIVKGLVNLINGEITFETNVGIGTSFYVKIPCFEMLESRVETTSTEIVKNELKDISILIVEDDEASFNLLKKQLLRETDLMIFHAPNGRSAIEQLVENSNFSCVLMDLHLPDMDGFEVTHKIKKINSKMPILAVTAAVMQSDRDKAMLAGCDAFFTKPVNIKNLVSLIIKYHQNN